MPIHKLQRGSFCLIVGMEMSCGLDSSLLNCYFAARGHRFLPATISYPGSFKATQRQKLQIFQEYSGLIGTIFDLDPITDYPLAHAAKGVEWKKAFFHDQDTYTPSFTRIADYFAAQGVTTVFRGVGGDELCEILPERLRTTRQEITKQFYKATTKSPWLLPKLQEYLPEALQKAAQPIPLLSQTIAAAPISAANPYIDRGIWPVSPLSDPVLYFYCQNLPKRFRTDKHIMRAYMYAKGFPKILYEPKGNEHFGYFFADAAQVSLSEPFELAMRNSVLADVGIVDPDRALSCWRQAVQPADIDHGTLFALYCLLTIELNLEITPTSTF